MISPLLLAFAEPIPPLTQAPAASLGTETFTKTIEGTDTDEREGGRWATDEATAVGTATHTSSSEEQDVDRDPMSPMALGTETYTEVRAEATDSDEPRRGSALWEVALL